MLHTPSDLISNLLRDAAVDLDIPPALRAAATLEYERVGNWLAAHADGNAGWKVYPQGSFLLNTVVRPVGQDEYDIDTVCRREIEKSATTQAELKFEVGEALERYVEHHRHLSDGPRGCKERNRCWTLGYDPSQHFHLDVLPSIPNPDAVPTGVLITDRRLHEWQRSNPLAYSDWFKHQAEAEFLAKRARLAEAERTAPQAIPDWQVKTTLHRVVQILKLHRNQYFRDDLDKRPASILVTTLAAMAYRGEQNLHDSLLQTVELMPSFITEGPTGPCVPNPVEPRENFADRWRDRPSLARQFFTWLDQFHEDLEDAASRRGIDKVAVRLQESFGAEPIEKAVGRLGDTYRRTREAGRLALAPTAGILTTGDGIRVRDHGFYGGDRRA